MGHILQSVWPFTRSAWIFALPAAVAVTNPDFLMPLKEWGWVDNRTTLFPSPVWQQIAFSLITLLAAFVGFHRHRMAFALSDAGPFDLPFSAVVERVAWHSAWGIAFDLARRFQWKTDLKREIYQHLTSGRIKAEGVLITREFEANGPSIIEAGFWVTASFDAEFLLMKAVDEGEWSSAHTSDDPPIFRKDIMFRKEEINRFWPKALYLFNKRKSPIRSWFEEWKENLELKHILRRIELEKQYANLA